MNAILRIGILALVTAAALAAAPTALAQNLGQLKAAEASSSLSTVTASAATVAAGSTLTLTMTVRNRYGEVITSGDQFVAFALGNVAAGTGSVASTGTFGPVTNNQNGTYSVVFTATGAGIASNVTATVNGRPLTGTLPSVQVTAAPVSSPAPVTPAAPASPPTTTPPATTGSTPAAIAGYTLTPPAQDANGWTILTPSANSQLIYVSSSGGNDNNNGLSAAAPMKTIAAAAQLLRRNMPDWLLLKAGDTFMEPLPHWLWCGPSAAQPVVFTSYGTGARPVISTGSNGAIDVSGGGGAPSSISNVWLVGLDFYADARDPNSPTYSTANLTTAGPAGMSWLQPGSNLLIEDCRFRFYADNLDIEPIGAVFTNVVIRRCEVLDAWNTTAAHSQGIFTDNLSNLLIEQCVYDNNGWNAQLISTATPTVFNHDLYIHGSSNVTVQNNVVSNASNFGAKIASDAVGGSQNVVVSNNLFLGDANCIGLGGSTAPAAPYYYDNVSVTGNVFTEGGRTINGAPQSWGIWMSTGQNMSFVGNYFVNKPFSQNGAELTIAPYQESGVLFANNVVYQWAADLIDNEATPATGVSITSNYIDLPASAFLDATRTVGTYDASVGGPGTSADFIQQARGLSKAAWSSTWNAIGAVPYVRWGFQENIGD